METLLSRIRTRFRVKKLAYAKTENNNMENQTRITASISNV